MNSIFQSLRGRAILGLGGLFLSLAMNVFGQVKTESSITSGAPTQNVSVERGQVLQVSGNDLIMKMEDGTIRHFKVSNSARAMVDGKELGINDLKPGMMLQRSLTVTTTPQIVTTVQTVSGKVWQVSPPNSVILTLEDGTNQRFTIPKGQKFMVDGQSKDAWGLKKGMNVSATKIVEEPVSLVEHQSQVTGSMPPPPPAPPADAPILIAVVKPRPVATNSAQSTAAELPKTGSFLPLIGLLGGVALFASIAIKTIRYVRMSE